MAYENLCIGKLLRENTYPGRGIIAGLTPDGKKAVTAYFIMGRSANSRNRVFSLKENGELYTEPFDASKVEDPSLIIYAAVRALDKKLIVTNGDQTDTVYDLMKEGKTFSAALSTRCFEPDGPNWTPRISVLLDFEDGFNYSMSILKSADADGSACNRFTFDYAPIAGVGHFIHTYDHDGNPIPTFSGEPERIATFNDMDEFAEVVWNNLNADNKISLFVRYIDLASGEAQTKIYNKNN